MVYQVFSKMEIMRNSDLIRSCAEAYCQVWQEPPWNEIGWTVPDVAEDIHEQLKKPGSQFFFAGTEEEVLGFTWGYFVTPENLRGISGGSQLDFLFNGNYLIFYVDELGVSSKYRNSGIGEKLSRLLLQFLGTGLLVLLRTDKKAEAAVRLYCRLDFTDLGIEDSQYPDRTYWKKTL